MKFDLRITGVIAAAAIGCARPAPLYVPLAEPVVSVTPITAPGYNNETSIAVDPSAPERMVAAWQVPATVGWTADGGASWSAGALPATDRWQLAGDPVVAFDADGHAYALYIAFDRPADYDTLGKAAHRNGIFVNRSDDGGRTWRPQPAAVIEQPERPGVPFEDKPQIAIDQSSDSARRGNVYVAWTEFRRWTSAILFARSTDGGRTFGAPVEISDRTGSPKDTVGAAEGTTLAVAPDGTVYVAWSDSIGVWIDRSTDGGRTFGKDVLVARTPDIVFGVPGVARANGYPSLAIDPRTRRMYIEWQDVRSGMPEPLIATSTDGGRTWSAPRPIAPVRDGAARFFAWLSVDPASGVVAVGYYRALAGGRLQYMLASSTDGGARFTERPWGRVFDPAGEFLGDYTGVVAYRGRAVAAWTEIERPDTSRAPVGVRGRHHARVVIGRAELARAGGTK